VRRLMSMPGIGPHRSCFVAAIDSDDLSRPGQVTSLGLVPREYSSGTSCAVAVRPSAHPRVQALLVESAWRICGRPIRHAHAARLGPGPSASVGGNASPLSLGATAGPDSYAMWRDETN